MSSHAIGADVGGTNFRMGLFDMEETPPRLIERVTEPIGASRAPTAVATRLVESSIRLTDEPCPIGIGFAGMLDSRTGHVMNSPHFGWRGVAFGDLVEQALQGRANVIIDNDVNMVLFGEFMHGAARGATDALAVFGGTGLGGAVISNGQLVSGARGVAGEIGHTKVDFSPTARACHCGKRGCVEAYVGGRCLAERARDELRGGARSSASEFAGGTDRVEASHLDAAAAAGDPWALALYDEICPLLGAVLANAITLLNPSHLILGGGVLSRAKVLRERALATMRDLANPPALDGLVLALAELGDDAGLVGAACLASAHISR